MSNAFVFYESIFEARQKMDANEALALYDAICYYFFRQEKKDTPAIVSAVLDVALPTLEAAFKRHEQACNAGKARWDKKTKIAGEEPSREKPAQKPVPAVNEPQKQPAKQEQPAPSATPAPPQPRLYHLGKVYNITLNEEEYRKIQTQVEDWKTTLDRFSMYKIRHGFTLLRDYEALLYFKKHGMIPKGKFERPHTDKTSDEIFAESFGKT